MAYSVLRLAASPPEEVVDGDVVDFEASIGAGGGGRGVDGRRADVKKKLFGSMARAGDFCTTMSVGQLVGWSLCNALLFRHLLAVFASLLLPKHFVSLFFTAPVHPHATLFKPIICRSFDLLRNCVLFT